MTEENMQMLRDIVIGEAALAILIQGRSNTDMLFFISALREQKRKRAATPLDMLLHLPILSA